MEPTPPFNPEERLEAALQKTVSALAAASPQQKAFLYKRAGDVCVGMDERRKALGWYGRAVDQYLQLGDTQQAELLCKLIIHVQPAAVRARCTLTWIAIGTGQETEAARQLTAYVESARAAEQATLAAQQLGWMFGAARSAALREQVVAAMRALGQLGLADQLAEELSAGRAGAGLSPEERWARLLDATVGSAAAAARTSPPQ